MLFTYIVIISLFIKGVDNFVAAVISNIREFPGLIINKHFIKYFVLNNYNTHFIKNIVKVNIQ